jgi:hypothetical protein
MKKGVVAVVETAGKLLVVVCVHSVVIVVVEGRRGFGGEEQRVHVTETTRLRQTAQQLEEFTTIFRDPSGTIIVRQHQNTFLVRTYRYSFPIGRR